MIPCFLFFPFLKQNGVTVGCLHFLLFCYNARYRLGKAKGKGGTLIQIERIKLTLVYYSLEALGSQLKILIKNCDVLLIRPEQCLKKNLHMHVVHKNE